MISRKYVYLLFLMIHLGFFISFTEKKWFWFFFPVLYLLLISIAMKAGMPRKLSSKELAAGTLSGLILYGIFAFGHWVLLFLPFPIEGYVHGLYESIGPREGWQHGLLLLVIAGEELFWRLFVQKRLLGGGDMTKRILRATALYTSVHLYSFNPLLIMAAITGGIYWGWLHEKTNNIYVSIVSHLVFDLFLLYILPFE
ncbi:CPBP family intramembrane glutamic endopeptidase [Bacillus songklensis]|uniref:CPBP family intramembrane glutamic endopeptidase n=1 Tax=Bacillus songklensis TaxID=1069116 RepID=A0ABV8B4Z8_9BACI